MSQIVYRCEEANSRRAMLHLADLTNICSLTDQNRRQFVSTNDIVHWIMLSDDKSEPYLEPYGRGLLADYGPNVEPQAAVYRRQYHFDTYLAFVGETEIKSRLDAIGENLVRYSTDGSPRLITNEEGLQYWVRKAEECAEAIRLRKDWESFVPSSSADPNIGPVSIKLTHNLTTKRNYAKYAPWNRVPELPERTQKALFKYGKSFWLKRAIDTGAIRLFPASFYADPSLNSAQRDERENSLLLRPSKEGLRDHP